MLAVLLCHMPWTKSKVLYDCWKQNVTISVSVMNIIVRLNLMHIKVFTLLRYHILELLAGLRIQRTVHRDTFL